MSNETLLKTDCDYRAVGQFHFSELSFHEQAVGTGRCRSSIGMSYYVSNVRTLHLLIVTEQIANSQHMSSK
jgi:hypothetical protein